MHTQDLAIGPQSTYINTYIRIRYTNILFPPSVFERNNNIVFLRGLFLCDKLLQNYTLTVQLA